MSKSLVIAVCLIGFGVLGNWYLVQVQPFLEAPNPHQQLYDELLRPSVMVTTEQGCGSGVIIHRKDAKVAKNTIYILSAAHVVGNEDSIDVTFYEYAKLEVRSWTLEGSVVVTDTTKDLALLKITSSNFQHPISNLKVAQLAPRGYTPHIFQPVWVIGCSLGYPPRPTSGEVTAISSPSPFSSPSRGEDRERVNHWGINAPIWPGNSGGGIFLKDTHELIGIAVWVRVCRGQLATTMGGIVPLQTIYEFLTRAGERLAINGKRFALIDTPSPNISNPTPQTTNRGD